MEHCIQVSCAASDCELCPVPACLQHAVVSGTMHKREKFLNAMTIVSGRHVHADVCFHIQYGYVHEARHQIIFALVV